MEVGKAVISCFLYFCIPIECQTEMEWFTVEAKICELEKQLMERPEFSVETILEANDKLTRFYTGKPTYESFLAQVEYLEPKALQLRAWRGTETTTNSNIEGTQQRGVSSQCFTCLSVANQSFAMLIRLQRGLESLDICTRFKISETTYSRMFST